MLIQRMAAIAIAAVACAAGIGNAHGDGSRLTALLDEHKCNVCHDVHEVKAGPSYAEIAARYRNHPDAIDRIAARVTRGAHGDALWHMPPHPELSRSEARSIARYILAIRPAPRGRSTTGPAT